MIYIKNIEKPQFNKSESIRKFIFVYIGSFLSINAIKL